VNACTAASAAIHGWFIVGYTVCMSDISLAPDVTINQSVLATVDIKPI